MKKTIKFIPVILFMLTSCIPQQNRVTIPTNTLPVRVEVSPTISVFDYVSNSEYKTECLNINQSTTFLQADFLNIYPGVTDKAIVNEILGDPKKEIVDGLETNLLYDNIEDVFLSLIIINDKVDKIYVSNINKTTPSLKEEVEKYGCPGIIRLIDRSEHSARNYDVAVFTHPEVGVEFWFDGIKVTLNSAPSEIRYFKPISLAGYIQLYNRTLYVNSPMSSPVYWHDVVIEK